MEPPIKRELSYAPRLLVIDPDLATVDLLVKEMGASGWQIDHARSFQEALVLETKAVYDFVILELVLPDATAIEAWELIRKINPDVLGVITTSSRALYRSVNPRQPGIISFLLKPFELRLVSDAAAHLLEYQRLRAENQALERKLNGLSNLASSISSTATAAQALKSTLAHLPSLLRIDRALVYLLDDHLSTWSLRMTSEALTFQSDQSDFLPFAEGLMSEAVETVLPINLDDSQTFDAKNGITSLQQVDLKALAVIPIMAGGKALGALALARGKEDGNAFTGLEVQVVSLASQILGLMLTNLRLMRQSRENLVYETMEV